MEMLVVRIIERIFCAMDGSFQRQIRKVVSSFDELRENPAATLAIEPIVIGSFRRYASALGLALVFAFCLFLVAGMPILGLLDRRHRDPILAILAVACVVIPVAAIWLGFRVVAGGRCTIALDGVTFEYRGTEVFCPWSLFNAPGQPVVQPLHLHNRMQLPIAAVAIPYVELRQHGYVVAHGLDIKARQFRLRSADEALVKNLYEVEPADLAELLLLLGRRLGSSGPSGPRP